MTQFSSCPAANELSEFLLGRLSNQRSEILERHLSECPQCAQTAHDMTLEDTLVVAMRVGGVMTQEDPPQILDLIRRLENLPVPRHSAYEQDTLSHSLCDTPSEINLQGVELMFGARLDTSELCDFLAPPRGEGELGWLGPYRVVKLLGAGGMGVVFEAEDVQLKRVVALKAMRPALASSASAGKRFLREAQACAAIKHDHIVTIYQVGEDRGIPYLAMELLEGEPLDERLKRTEKLPLAEVLHIGRQTAEGLAAFHARGLVHRDIKPANLWLEVRGQKAEVRGQKEESQAPLTSDLRPLTSDFRVKILDFGLARAAAGGEGEELTQAGAIVGTPCYMAPEQAGGTVDPRADLFSLGVLLYRLCTGRLPFPGKDTITTLLAVAMQEARLPHEIDPTVPAALSDLIGRLMAKDPEGRPASARSVVESIDEIERQSNPHAPRESPPSRSETPAARRPRWPLPLGLAVLAVAVLGVIIYVQTSQGTLQIVTEDPQAKVVVEKDGQKITIDAGDGRTVRLDPGTWRVRLENNAAGPTLASVAPPPAKAPFDAAQARAHQEAWASHLGTQVETTNGIGAKLILIPPGEFLMGSSEEQIEAALKKAAEIKADQDTKDRIEKAERPQHRVVITQPFLMGATEVTVGQFKQFAAATGYLTEAEKAAEKAGKVAAATYQTAGGAVLDDSPAAVITWYDAVAYCQWLSRHEKTTFRLPTEAEWEYACRVGTTTQYAFGDDMNQVGPFGWHIPNARDKPRPVGTKKANGFGLHDLHGNLWEWCHDFYDEKWYEKSPSHDPQGPVSGDLRVLRGGGHQNSAFSFRSAFRFSGSPSQRSLAKGFRVVRVLDLPPAAATAATPTDHDPQRFSLDKDTFTLKRGGKTTVTIRRVAALPASTNLKPTPTSISASTEAAAPTSPDELGKSSGGP